jgi:hypothetical protein
MIQTIDFNNRKVYPMNDCFGCAAKTIVIKCSTINCKRQMCYSCWSDSLNTTQKCPSCCNIIKEKKPSMLQKIKTWYYTYIDIINFALLICGLIIIIVLSYHFI